MKAKIERDLKEKKRKERKREKEKKLIHAFGPKPLPQPILTLLARPIYLVSTCAGTDIWAPLVSPTPRHDSVAITSPVRHCQGGPASKLARALVLSSAASSAWAPPAMSVTYRVVTNLTRLRAIRSESDQSKRLPHAIKQVLWSHGLLSSNLGGANDEDGCHHHRELDRRGWGICHHWITRTSSAGPRHRVWEPQLDPGMVVVASPSPIGARGAQNFSPSWCVILDYWGTMDKTPYVVIHGNTTLHASVTTTSQFSVD
jgi:hypothetical protein